MRLFLLLFIFAASLSTEAQQRSEKTYKGSQKDLKNMHTLMQGTFVAHSQTNKQELESWNVTGGDSVILYTRQIGDIQKDGYWLYSYEFMTSLPDKPIYTSVKQIKQISKDSFRIFYYKFPYEFRLKEVLDSKDFAAGIDLKSLEQRDKKVLYCKRSKDNFVGKSVLYKDKQFSCLRQNSYDISPEHYRVSFNFYNEETRNVENHKRRPNLMIRRNIAQEDLLQIANK